MPVFLSGKKIIFLAGVLLLAFSVPGFTQKIDSTLAVYANRYEPERTYIQFDKPAYYPGETIWFKAYLMSGIYPSDISKNFYIDWMDDNGTIIYRTTAPIYEESAFGQFQVPLHFAGSTLHLRAYTSWMLNFDSAFLYRKDIRIFQKNPVKSSPKPILPSLEFFPEGGDAIAALNDKIAFLANDQYGRPVNIKGVISNSRGTIVDSLKTIHDGMGYFFLNPHPGETYTAKWTDEQGKIHLTALPAAIPEGVMLQVKITGDQRSFLIERTPNAPANLHKLHLIATMQQNLVYMANVNLTSSTMVGGAIPVGQLPTGVLQITLFDSAWRPMAERITFVNNNDAVFYPEVGFSSLGLSKRGSNVLEIDVPDSIQTNLSVSVTDAGIGEDTSDNIITHMLLTGDIRGYVNNPTYYFSNAGDSVVQALDLVMLTHGWRRFDWSRVLAGKLPDFKYPRDSSYLGFTGKIFGATPDQLRDAGEIVTIIRSKDSTQKTLAIPIHADGTFSEPGMIFYDTLKVYYEFPVPNMSDMTAITLSNGLLPFPKQVGSEKFSSLAWLDTAGKSRSALLAGVALKDLFPDTTLKEVIVTAKARSAVDKLDDKYASAMFQGSDAYQFDVVDDVSARGYPSVLNYLQGRVAGLAISIDGANNVTLNWRGEAPQIFLDEMPVEVSQITSLSMSDVAYVKVFRPPFMGSSNGGGGAIAVYTRKGGDEKQTTTGKGLPYKYIAGYSPVRQFYSPNYGTFNQENENADYRSTLYWNPMILTNQEKHIIRLQFYNNDITDSFRVILEGMSKDGKLTRVEKLIE